MIIDTIDNCKKYENLHTGFKEAFDAIKKIIASEFKCGRIDICGGTVYGSLQEYETKTVDKPRFEMHNKYIDIQFLVSGEETILIGKRSDMTPSEAYDESCDAAFYESSSKVTAAYMQENTFAVIYPDEPHAPCISVDKASKTVKKIVVKVLA